MASFICYCLPWPWDTGQLLQTIFIDPLAKKLVTRYYIAAVCQPFIPNPFNNILKLDNHLLSWDQVLLVLQTRVGLFSTYN